MLPRQSEVAALATRSPLFARSNHAATTSLKAGSVRVETRPSRLEISHASAINSNGE